MTLPPPTATRAEIDRFFGKAPHEPPMPPVMDAADKWARENGWALQ